jgi:hypothetical protein
VVSVRENGLGLLPLRLETAEHLQLGEQDSLLEAGCGWKLLGCG